MLTADFHFDLPESSIAQEPLPRGTSRLLVLDDDGEGRHRKVADLPDLLREGDLLVVNDTKVIPARLYGVRPPGGGKTELLLVEKTGPRTWRALGRPGKRLRPGTRVDFPGSEIYAEIGDRLDEGQIEVRFSVEVESHLRSLGHVPLPPYIRRQDRDEDHDTYQTVYAKHEGAVAAPTAGLHFNDEILGRLTAKGVRRAAVTLHVGIGTFKPVTAEKVEDHPMDEERYVLSPETVAAIEETRARGGRVVAVGTTVVRTLESAARNVAAGKPLEPGSDRTRLFITPGFEFRVVDALLTNFHLPCSTLLMLVPALAGADNEIGRDRVLAAYRQAVETGYRFYSYGDAMFLSRNGGLNRSGGLDPDASVDAARQV